MKLLLACVLLAVTMTVAQAPQPPPEHETVGPPPVSAQPAPDEPTVLSPAVEAAAEEVMPEAVVEQVENVAQEVAEQEGQNALFVLLATLTGIMGSVWIAAEFIGNTAKIEKSIVGLIFGPIVTALCWALGWVEIKDGWLGFVAALVFGLFAAAMTGSLHRQIKQATGGTP